MDLHTPRTGTANDVSDLINSLVNTYRELNTRFRPLDEETLAASGARDIVFRMRGDELRFAQALKERVTGIGTLVGDDEDARIRAMETEDDSTMMMISQFGNARATTLSLLKDVSHDKWTEAMDDGASILDHVRALVSSDQNQLRKLADLVRPKQ